MPVDSFGLHCASNKVSKMDDIREGIPGVTYIPSLLLPDTGHIVRLPLICSRDAVAVEAWPDPRGNHADRVIMLPLIPRPPASFLIVLE